MDKKKEPTTLSVHRCRFVDYAPSAITALAYSPLPLPSIKGKKGTTNGAAKSVKFGLLAVGHANGNIDICEWMGGEGETQCSQAWVVQKTLPGPYPSKVDSLAFVIRHPDDLTEDDIPSQLDLRLFSSGGGSELVEWDLEKSCIRRTIGSQGGSIWSIATNPGSTQLALGCEDGTVRILSVAHDTLSHLRRFDKVKCRMLSVAWGPPIPRQKKPTTTVPAGSDEDSDSDDDEDEWSDSFLVTGGSDSSLRKWDIATGRVIERMGVDKVRNERTLVWTVGVLGDGTIISGDSMGMVKFWDARTCTQLHSFQAHGADVLCMAISPEGKTVYTAGVDQKTVQFSLVKTNNARGSISSQWTQSTSRRMHSHDVRALAIWPPYTPLPAAYKRQFRIDVAPVLASGGLDMALVFTPAALPSSTVVKVANPLETSLEATFEEAYHRKTGFIPQGVIRVARSARLVSCAFEAGISVWKIQPKGQKEEKPQDFNGLQADDDDDLTTEEGGWERVLDMELAVHSNIVAHEISDDGKWLAVSDLYESKLFALENTDGKITVKRVKEFSSILRAHIPSSSSQPVVTGALAFQFSPDCSKLVISTAISSHILVLDLSGETPQVLRRFDHHREQTSVVRNRFVKPRPSRSPHVNGNGVAADGDVDMADGSVVEASDDGGIQDSGNDSSEDEEPSSPSKHVGVHCIAISADGQWLATSDSQSRTHVFNLDSVSYHTTLPSFHRPARALLFDPSHPSTILLAFPDNTVHIYDVETKQFPAWGKELTSTLPKKFTNAHEPILGASFEPPSADPSLAEEDCKSRFILFWSATWLFKVGLGVGTRTFRVSNGAGKKRRRAVGAAGDDGVGAAELNGVLPLTDEERPWRDCKMITQYRPIGACEFLSREELVVVERPLVDVLATLPPAYFKHKYGSS